MNSSICYVCVVVILLAVAAGVCADVELLSDLTTANSWKQETSLGDLVADAIRHATGAPIAIFPAAGFRDEEVTIPRGRVVIQDILKCLQYPQDKLAVIELSGEQIVKAFERSVSIYPQPNRNFLQVAGVSIEFDPKAPKGARIIKVLVGGEEIQPQKKYRVGTTKPLADGGQGYFTIWGKEVKPSVVDKTVAKAVEDFLAGKNSVDYRKLDRIQVKER
jgi:5'-nucleotidase/UDP-sugar diphosphatase